MRVGILFLLLGLASTGCAAPTSEPTEDEGATAALSSNSRLKWAPTEASDWDIVPSIVAYQRELPADVEADRASLSAPELTDGATWAWTQDVVEAPDAEPRSMSVELTTKRILVPYDTFAERLPTASWGPNLAHYLGGEIRVYSRDEAGRPTRQLERMVLSALPCNANLPMINSDMTKVEVIDYGTDRATVYWRVRHSDNGSTASDVGTLTFERYDDESTLVTFHSAHRLRAFGALPIPAWAAMPALQRFFLDQVWHYEQLASQ